MEAEPLDVIEQHDAGHEEDLGEVEGLDALPLVSLELDTWRQKKVLFYLIEVIYYKSDYYILYIYYIL